MSAGGRPGGNPAGQAGMKTGKLPVNAMKRSVLGQIRTKRREVLSGAGMGEDCAIFSSGPEEETAVCVQEAVLCIGRTGIALSVAACAGQEAGTVVSPEKGLQSDCIGQDRAAASAEREELCGQPVQDAAARRPVWEAEMTLADLIVKCVGNLAAGGARPVAVLPVLLLPETVQEPEIRALMAQAEEKCAELSLEIAGGQTRVTSAVSAPLATVTAYGVAAKGQNHSVRAAAPGQDVVLSKWIGLEGTARIAEICRGQLLERYPAWLVEEAAGFGRYLSVLPEAEAAVKFGVCAMHDASEGGILGALWELAEGAGTGLSVDMRRLPLRQETVEVCECCGVNPYELLSGGCLVMTAWDGQGLAAALEAAGIPATVVGKITGGNDRILKNGEETRYLDRPQRDGIYRIAR